MCSHYSVSDHGTAHRHNCNDPTLISYFNIEQLPMRWCTCWTPPRLLRNAPMWPGSNARISLSASAHSCIFWRQWLYNPYTCMYLLQAAGSPQSHAGMHCSGTYWILLWTVQIKWCEIPLTWPIPAKRPYNKACSIKLSSKLYYLSQL